MLQKLSSHWRAVRGRSREGHLPAWRQCAEIAYLYLFYSIGPGYYDRAGLYRSDMPFAAKCRFRVGRQYETIIQRYNDSRYQMLVRSKMVEKAILTQFKINTPRFYGYFHPRYGHSTYGNTLKTSEELLAMLIASGLPSMAVKHTIGAEGKGFDIIDLDQLEAGSVSSRALGESLSLDKYLALKHAQSPGEGLILEAEIRQHPTLAALNPSSVNTIRFWVTQAGESATVRSAVLKIGSPGSLVDYTATGGAAAPIDLETGRLGIVRGRPGATADSDTMPAHGTLEIPFFKDACRLAERAIEVFPGLDFVGMDVAIGTDGPVVVELNDEPSIGHPGLVGVPTLDLLEPLPAPRPNRSSR